ncbi:MAG: 50S ribosomal protein L32 [Rhodothermia bacterium]|nr:50S ribosomal protein L32 [Rhodothermia bacterium]
MANPKRRHSKARTRQRRSKYYSSVEAPNLMECPNCGDTKMRHHACPSCGFYRGRQVVERAEVD